MRKSIFILFLFCATLSDLLAQDITPYKNKSGVTLSTNFFGINDDLNNIDIGGGVYFSRKISNSISIYTEIAGISRNYGELSLMPGLSGNFTADNVAIYVGPMLDIGEKMNLSLGVVNNYFVSAKVKTSNSTKDLIDETTDYSSLFFDFRKSIYKEVSLGVRYEWGLNSMFHSTDRKVSSISFNLFLQLRGKVNKKIND